jgi:hypothetical protein
LALDFENTQKQSVNYDLSADTYSGAIYQMEIEFTTKLRAD